MEFFLKNNGLKWENKKSDETIWEAFNNKLIFKEEEWIPKDKLQYLFKYKGALCIENKDIFLHSFECESWLDEIPQEIFGIFYILAAISEGYNWEDENGIVVDVDYSKYKNKVENFQNEEFKNTLVEGYKIKKIFHREATEEEFVVKLGEELDRIKRSLKKTVEKRERYILNSLAEYCSLPEDPEKL